VKKYLYSPLSLAPYIRAGASIRENMVVGRHWFWHKLKIVIYIPTTEKNIIMAPTKSGWEICTDLLEDPVCLYLADTYIPHLRKGVAFWTHQTKPTWRDKSMCQMYKPIGNVFHCWLLWYGILVSDGFTCVQYILYNHLRNITAIQMQKVIEDFCNDLNSRDMWTLVMYISDIQDMWSTFYFILKNGSELPYLAP
jgi:hypothetical protein